MDFIRRDDFSARRIHIQQNRHDILVLLQLLKNLAKVASGRDTRAATTTKDNAFHVNHSDFTLALAFHDDTARQIAFRRQFASAQRGGNFANLRINKRSNARSQRPQRDNRQNRKQNEENQNGDQKAPQPSMGPFTCIRADNGAKPMIGRMWLLWRLLRRNLIIAASHGRRWRSLIIATLRRNRLAVVLWIDRCRHRRWWRRRTNAAHWLLRHGGIFLRPLILQWLTVLFAHDFRPPTYLYFDRLILQKAVVFTLHYIYYWRGAVSFKL